MNHDILHENLMSMLALLFAQRVNYQTVHWQAGGKGYYGDHLLFQRLYEDDEEGGGGLPTEIDELGEKIVGILGGARGVDPINNLDLSHRMFQWLQSWAAFPCPLGRSLQSELDLQSYWKQAYENLDTADSLTLGLDDWIMSSASAHETNLYLLQQRLAHHGRMRKASQKLTRAWFSAPVFGRGREAADDKESD